MSASLSSLADDLSEIKKKERTNEVIDNFRFMLASLSSHVDNLSDINKKGSDINRKESTNEFINNFRIMIATLSSYIDDLSEINKKESVNELIEKFLNTYRFFKGDLSKFALLSL